MTNRNSIFCVNNNSSQTDEPDYRELSKIGLTKMATDCYEALTIRPYSTTKEVSNRLNKPYRSVQRCLNDLQDKGFIRHVYTGFRPNKYEARLLYEAMAEYANWQERQIEQLIEAQKIHQYEKELAKLNLKTRHTF